MVTHLNENSTTMKEEEANVVNSLLYNRGGGCGGSEVLRRPHIQFFVHMMSGRGTIIIHAYPEEDVKSIHERIQSMVGIPLFGQTLIYKGKQLPWEQTLTECSIQNNANLQLVDFMSKIEHCLAWQVINDMVTLIYNLCHGEIVHDSIRTIKGFLTKYINTASVLDKASKLDTSSTFNYFQIFLNLYAPSMFVILYFSRFPGNKLCADSSIRHFLTSCCNTLSNAMHTQCARVVLEFCKFLSSENSRDPLYLFCRSNLGFLLETATFSYAASEIENVEGLILIQDIFSFVRELGNSLLSDLDLSMESPFIAGKLLNDVRDFTAFLVPLRRGIRDLQAVTRGSIIPQKRHKNVLLNGEILYLHLLYNELLNKIDQCLQKVEESLVDLEVVQEDKDNSFYPVFSQYLSILKELYQISKLYDGAEEMLWSVVTRQKSVLFVLIVRYSQNIEEHLWILEHKSFTNFESRRHLAMLMFPEIKEDSDEDDGNLIDRSHLLTESFKFISQAEPALLHDGLYIQFENEEATGPGVLREWFLLVCQEIFNPQNALFAACPNDLRRFFPSPASKIQPHHLEYFSFAGRVIALALMHIVEVGIAFDRVFFLQLAGKCITLEDIKDADPFLYTSCKKILEMDSEFIDSDALGLTFVREVEEFGHRKMVELCCGGKNISVNSKNREKYVHLLIQDCFVTSISEQVSHFAKGFADILSNAKHQKLFFQILELEDLDWMLYGSQDTISVEDWKAHTEYNGYNETDIQISWFWEIVERMTAEERKNVLFFWTSVKHLPVEGFCGLDSWLNIEKSYESDAHFPSSHTCHYQLYFPAYSSMDVMENRLKAIAKEYIAYGFGTL